MFAMPSKEQAVFDSEHYFHCTSQERVLKTLVCDGVLDCQDASDETNCIFNVTGIL
jgi:hypothetical protein